MIPLAIELEGFLSFRDRESIEFGRDTVWLLGGRNGVGKSSVFDGILFALYGAHRAGNKNLEEVINKQCDRGVVRFDFELDRQSYRAERCVKRTVDLQTGQEGYETEVLQIYTWQSDGEAGSSGQWKPIPDKNKKRGQDSFNEWIQHKIGLSREAFSVSVLLMQGKADGLVAQDAKAANHRFNVLARLMELDEYQKVQKLADKRRKKWEKEVTELDGKLAECKALQPGELEAINRQLSETAASLAAEDAEARRLDQRAKGADEWKRLQAEQIKLAQQMEEAGSLLGDAARIEKEGARWTELSAVLPPCQSFLDYRCEEEEIVRRMASLPSRQQELQAHVDTLSAELAAIRQTLDANQLAQDADERQQQEWEDRIQQMDALAILQHFHDARERLREALAASRTANDHEEAAGVQARQHEAAVVPLRQELATAIAARVAADHAVVRAEANWQSTQKRADRFRSVAGEQMCGYCGQTLDTEHIEIEQQRITEELTTYRQQHTDAVVVRDDTRRKEEALTKQFQETERLWAEAKQQAANARGDRRQAEKDIQRSRGECAKAYHELGPSFRTRIAEAPPTCWSETLFPAREELDRLSAEKNELRKGLETLRRNMDERRKHGRDLTKQREGLEKDEAAAQKECGDAAQQLRDEQGNLLLCKQRQADILTAFPADWRERASQIHDTDLMTWQREHRELTARDASGRLQRLREAQNGLKPMEQRIKELDKETGGVPEECRCDPDEVHEARQAVQARIGDLQIERGRLEKEGEALRHRHQKHEELSEQRRQADRQRFLYARLMELLGPKQLQRYLVRQAEQGVVENANHILKKLSDSRMQLQLRRDESSEEEAALQLVAYKPLDGRTYNLSFLSGSERFRVAVALALGIGQYANKRHRPIESIIIDEGFGCLDRENRTVMIEELKRLIQSLHCILLVSHQEEFAEAFPEGHRFEIIDGTTRVRRCGEEEDAYAEEDMASVVTPT